jgi:molybdate transport system substrate-binding protein
MATVCGIPGKLDVAGDDVVGLWQRGEVRRIALADPRLAPYGLAAEQALRAAGLWERLQPRLVFAENVAQALQHAETGNAEAALTALSLCRQAKGRWIVVPAELHQPLDQALVLIRDSPRVREARGFAAFLLGPRGQDILSSCGYEVPGR